MRDLLGACARFGLAAASLASGLVEARAQIVSGSASIPFCFTATGVGANCTDTGYLNETPVGANSTFIGAPEVGGSATPATFTSAFGAWNAANGDHWKLVNGGVADVTVTPSLVGLGANAYGGGLDPVIFTVSGPAGVLKHLVWTQALVVNFSPLYGPLSAPIQYLDSFDFSQNAAGDNPYFPTTCSPASFGASPPGGAFCGPVYPFQYGSTLNGQRFDGVPLGVDPFVDAPEGGWPNASFEAITLLSAVTAPDTLTVYQGVAYGFTLSVPEPPTWALLMLALPALVAITARHRRSAPVLAIGAAESFARWSPGAERTRSTLTPGRS